MSRERERERQKGFYKMTCDLTPPLTYILYEVSNNIIPTDVIACFIAKVTLVVVSCF